MDRLTKPSRHKVLLLCSILIVILVAIAWIGAAVLAPSESGQKPGKDERVHLTGDLVCLPHKNTDGPQTLECATGLKVGEEYYSLKDEAQKIGTVPFNTPVRVEGSLKLEDSDVYQTRGSIIVESVVEVPKSPQ